MAQPTRHRIEPGIYERIDSDGQRLGLELVYKDANGRTRRRGISGGIDQARDELAKARTKRVSRASEPDDPRRTFNMVADEFEAVHVASLRPNTQQAYRSALVRLREAFGNKRMTKITRADVRAFVAAERRELKANTINGHLGTLSAVYTFARDDLDLPVVMPRLKPSERPRAADDARERRILSDDELRDVLDRCAEPLRLYFRTLAETGARESEVLGLTARRIAKNEITFAEQLARDGTLAPLKTANSRRTIEITASLAAALKLAAGRGRVFEHLAHRRVERGWIAALDRANLADPQPRIHDLRHTHVSGLIADGWDPVEVAQRIGDTLATTLNVYSHEFDSRRRSEARRGALEARYGAEDGNQMATQGPHQSATEQRTAIGHLADLQAVRNRPR